MSPRHLQSDGQLVSYGGDAKVVATRVEIDRVMSELSGLEAWLRDQVEFGQLNNQSSQQVRLALEIPPILERLSRIRDACGRAADSYFDGEVEISRELRAGPKLPVPELASALAGAGAWFGVLNETNVSAELVGVAGSVSPPTSIGTLALRLSDLGELSSESSESAWIRIEKFREPASPVSAEAGLVSVAEARYVVYIPGTQDWAARPGQNPFDLTSNLSAISKTGFAGSERAVALAMKQAGIGADSQVLLVGHSQGGMIAANLSKGYAQSKVLTFGAPISQKEVIAPTLSIEHMDDPVPHLDAAPNPLRDNWVTVRQKMDGLNPLAQHEMKGYARTAASIDQAAEGPSMLRIRDEIAKFAGSPQATGQAFSFELKREP